MFSRRQLNFAGFAACAGLMAYAFFAEYVLELEPCPLCMLQRLAVVALGAVFLVAFLHNPGRVGAAVYALFILLAAGAGAGVAGRHVWLQNLPPDQVPACGPDWDFMVDAFPLAEMLEMVLSGSGECADISWSFLGLSMPAWVLISVTVLGVYGLVVNLRRG
jgi:disulfide bond formation protein DsbB